jgi:hypothetical protein
VTAVSKREDVSRLSIEAISREVEQIKADEDYAQGWRDATLYALARPYSAHAPLLSMLAAGPPPRPSARWSGAN